MPLDHAARARFNSHVIFDFQNVSIESAPGFVPNWTDEGPAPAPKPKLARPDSVPHLGSSTETPLTNGFLTDATAWLAKKVETQPRCPFHKDSSSTEKFLNS
jgi:hypothetical protein